MFEFINYGILLLSIGLVALSYMMLQVDKRVGLTTNTILKINIVFLILVNIYLPYNSLKNAEINKFAFNNGDNLQCIVNNNMLGVSKERNWSIDNNYFYKDDLVVKINLCIKI